MIQRGNNRQVIFKDTSDYSLLLTWLAAAIMLHRLSLHAYALMANHLHLLVTPQTPEAVGKVMQSLGRRYVRYFNTKYERTGTLWEGRYRATVIDSEEYFLTCSLYIEQNPVRAGIVQSPLDYKWTSYGHNALGRCDPLIVPGEVYSRLGQSPAERQSAYMKLHQEFMSTQSAAAIREATAKGWALGREPFLREVEQRSGRPSTPVGRGRRKVVHA